MTPYLESTLEIDLSALSHNLEVVKNKLDKSTKILAVVKAAAYGSSAIEVAKHMAQEGVDYLAVAYVKEGVALRNAGVQLPILVLHPQAVNFNSLIKSCLEPSIYSQRMLHEFLKVAASQNLQHYPIHLKINTGLNRLGFDPAVVPEIIDKLKNPCIEVRSVFTHLAASEDAAERSFTLKQLERFNRVLEILLPELDKKPIIHATNTSAILNYPEAHYDMVRTGIGLYGFGNASEYDQQFKPVSALYSVISQIHEIEKGHTVGYNRAFEAPAKVRTATIPLGHADGISRIYGNGVGWVTINGQKAPMIGNICMDMLMVDITNIHCQEGDSVVVFGVNNTAGHLAQKAGTISYELLTAVSGRIKRVVVRK